jgi:hypothetical protein
MCERGVPIYLQIFQQQSDVFYQELISHSVIQVSIHGVEVERKACAVAKLSSTGRMQIPGLFRFSNL